MSKDALIVAVAADRLSEKLRTSGFHIDEGPRMFDELSQAGLWLGPRWLLEENDSFLQLIPYVVLRKGRQVACYQRSASGNEGRLRGMRSIGLGGHIEIADAVMAGPHIDPQQTIELASRRELLEEVGDLVVVDQCWRGWIVDRDSPVGRVHLGLVGIWTVENSSIHGAEDAIADSALVDIVELSRDSAHLESWSRMIIPMLLQDLG